MKILFVTADANLNWGGVNYVVTGLAGALAKHNEAPTILAVSRTGKDLADKPTQCKVTPVQGNGRYQFSTQAMKQINELIPQHDIVHIHGLWQFPLSYAASVARYKKVPYFCQVHGMLGPWAVNHHGFRKRIYAFLWERANLNHANTVICVTPQETQEAVNFGIKAPTFVIPNGVERNKLDSIPPRSQFRNKNPKFANKFIILFLGRLHPKKGIDALIKAYGRLFQKPGNTHLIIAGPEEDQGYVKRLRGLVGKQNLSSGVTFLGPVYDKAKWELLSGSDLFVLPSKGEGFSVAVLEAMAASLPVVITRECHFPEIETNGAGCIFDGDVDSLVLAISKILVDERRAHEMGERGRQMVQSKYHWEAIALKLMPLYRQAIEKSKKNK